MISVDGDRGRHGEQQRQGKRCYQEGNFLHSRYCILQDSISIKSTHGQLESCE
jgi:hypothetical protein